MAYIVDIDGEEYCVTSETMKELEDRDLVEFCESCSSDFSGEYVVHPFYDLDDEEYEDLLALVT